MNTPTTDYVIVIPARFHSERLPGKMLLDIGGRPMIEWVWRAANQSSARQVVVATDDPRIAEVVETCGGQAVMTRADHASGSDRIAECAALMQWPDDQLVVNLQGDEPEMPPACLGQVAGLLSDDPEAAVATLYWPIDHADEVRDPNVVKVVTSVQGDALYFSRAITPHPRGMGSVEAAIAEGVQWKRHLGLYAYRLGALNAFTAWAVTPLERAEKLEQLRFLEYGQRIRIEMAIEPIPAGVDTPRDLKRVRARLTAES